MNTLMDILKESTMQRHARMEALPFVDALTTGSLPLQSYVAQLRAMAVIHATLEHELRSLAPNRLTSLYLSRPSRLAHLRSDLSVFDRLCLPDCLKAIDMAQQIAALVRKTRIDQPEIMPGFFYLFEGMTLGNAVHLADLHKTFGDELKGACHYYAGYGDKTQEYWQEFRFTMNSLSLDQNCIARIQDLVHGVFDLLEPLYSALYPIKESGWGFTASMLNPEAGNHPVPDSAEELEAAIKAAVRCRQLFTYFDERYGDRGAGFAKSDAAWLVVLSELPYAEMVSQVEWLGRVLGNRGMPRITLEQQLILLHEELVKAVPEKQNQYASLRDTAYHLKAERTQRISDTRFTDLCRQFDLAAETLLPGRLQNTGMLIFSAVCDEDSGIPEAVKSLVDWLGNPERFPMQWIAQVEASVELGRKELRNYGQSD